MPHLMDVREALGLLHAVCVTIKLKKFDLFQRKENFVCNGILPHKWTAALGPTNSIRDTSVLSD